MDIGDIGILIIAFILYLINLFVKMNKEKIEAQAKKQNTAKPESPDPWEVEEALPPLFDKSRTHDREFEVDKKAQKPFMTSSTSFTGMKDRMHPSQEGMSSLSESLFKEDNMESVSYRDEETEGEVSYTNELFHGDITEELKKAIIYSEILHRKYE